MNYLKAYNDIIIKAKEEDNNGKRSIGYFEKHHIKPKSLGGLNDESNLVKLTAREHFICHWLLVKIYDIGTEERNKMLCALWRMRSNPTKENERYINARAYEKLRIEFAETIGIQNSINQQGEKNSQFGTKWYTNRITGESKKFKEQPIEDFWIEGRNLFKHQSSCLYSVKELKNMQKAKAAWDEYHSGNYYSIRDYCRQTNKFSQPNLIGLFKKYIPISKNILIGRSHNNKSNPDLIGKYFDI